MKFEMGKSALRLFVVATASLLTFCGCRTEVMTARENVDPAERDTISEYPGRDEMIARQAGNKTLPVAKPQEAKPKQDKIGSAIEPMESFESKPITSDEKNSVRPASAKGGSYKVVSGDSLDRIARRNGTTVSKLAAYNNLNPAKPIRIGQTILLPPAGYKGGVAAVKAGSSSGKTGKTEDKTAATGSAEGLYTVKPGDSIDRIARRLKVKRADLSRANGLTDKSILRVGQKLIVPGSTADKVQPAAAPQGNAAIPTTGGTNQDRELANIMNDLAQGQTAAPAQSNAAAPAIPAVQTPAAPAATNAAVSGSMVEVVTDTAVADFATRNGTTVDALQKANAGVWPTDGMLKAGTLIVLP